VTGDITVGLLGPVEASRSGRPVALGGPKPQLVLAMLVTHRGALVPSSRLCEVLWGDAQPPSAVATLQSHISRLRSSLGPTVTISARPSGYCLELPGQNLDVTRFEWLLAGARRASGPEETECGLAEALALWRGEPYGELGGLEWFHGEARRLDELRLTALEDWIEARLSAGHESDVVGELEGLVAQHPLHERFWRQLMTALYRTGRQPDAVRRASALRSVLRDEMGLDPSPAFKELEARILQDDPSLTGPAASVTHAGRRRGGARNEPTSFIGRGDAVTDLVSAMEENCLVSVTGPGGVGKTRLARRVAAQAAPAFDQVIVVELAPLRDAAGLCPVIAGALDVQQRQHRSIEDTVFEFLYERDVLLVLDNCEHLIDPVAGFVERLLLRCPMVTVLTTGREPLRLAGEYVHALAPLAAPAASVTDVEQIAATPAVQLFTDRARAATPGFTLGSDNAVAVAEICRRLDGLPLALELAAARLRALSPAALAERLDARFTLLGSSRQAVDARQRTLYDLVEWSHELLDSTEREVFAQLSAFAGTFDLDDACALCLVDDDDADVVEVLADLVDKSMVQCSDPHHERYHLLETLREYGHRRLVERGAVPETDHRHLRWYVELARRGSAGLDGPDEPAWSARLDHELDNFRTAHAFALRVGDLDAAAGLVHDLREHSFRRIRYEVSSWADATIDAGLDDDHPLLPVVLGVSAYGRWTRGDLETAIALARRAVALQDRSGTGAFTGLPERVLGNALFYQGDTDEALVWMDRMVDVARSGGSAPQLAHALYMRSVAHTSMGESIRGAILAGEASGASRQCGSPTATAQAVYALGVALQGSDPVAAMEHLRVAATTAERAGNRWLRGFALTEVHGLVARDGRPLEALNGYAEVIETWYRGGDWANQWLSLRHVLGILIALGEHQPAAVLHGGLAATGAAYALPYEPADAQRLADDVAAVRQQLGPANFAAAARIGTALADDQLVTYALDQIRRLTA
jgi:predicted ATPase/DNA-binding SARP family transcriptional activator